MFLATLLGNRKMHLRPFWTCVVWDSRLICRAWGRAPIIKDRTSLSVQFNQAANYLPDLIGPSYSGTVPDSLLSWFHAKLHAFLCWFGLLIARDRDSETLDGPRVSKIYDLVHFQRSRLGFLMQRRS